MKSLRKYISGAKLSYKKKIRAATPALLFFTLASMAHADPVTAFFCRYPSDRAGCGQFNRGNWDYPRGRVSHLWFRPHGGNHGEDRRGLFSAGRRLAIAAWLFGL